MDSGPARAGAARPRVIALLAPGAERRRRRARRRHPRAGRAHRGAARGATPACTLVGIDRDVAAIDAARERARAVRRPGHLVHAVYDEIAGDPGAAPARRDRAGVDGVLFDLGRLLGAAGRRRPRLRLRPRRAAGHADGPDGRHHRGRRRQHLPGRRADPDPARVRRGTVRAAHRLRRRRASGPASRSPPARGSSNSSVPRFRRPPGAPAATPPSAPSRRCGSRSTTSSVPCGGRFPLRCNALSVADGSW